MQFIPVGINCDISEGNILVCGKSFQGGNDVYLNARAVIYGGAGSLSFAPSYLGWPIINLWPRTGVLRVRLPASSMYAFYRV